jgi:hypothetical protein
LIQGNGFTSEQFLFLIADGVENNPQERLHITQNFINYLNNEVSWKYPNQFVFCGDETVTINGDPGKLGRYLLNADISAFLGKYIYDSTATQVMQSEETLDTIFENPKNKALAPTFLSQFWNAWT